MSETKEKIIAILSEIERPGMDAVINYMNTSNYFKCWGGGHHYENGGLAAHCLEVYNVMKAVGGGLPKDSIAIAGLFHDLGKTRRHDGRGHWNRSLDILDECGFELTADERYSIGHHHDKTFASMQNPLRRVLSLADSASTGAWKIMHPKCR